VYLKYDKNRAMPFLDEKLSEKCSVLFIQIQVHYQKSVKNLICSKKKRKTFSNEEQKFNFNSNEANEAAVADRATKNNIYISFL
jgi:hypothetical protein